MILCGMARPKTKAQAASNPTVRKASKKTKAAKPRPFKKAEQPNSLLLRDLDPEVVGALKARADRAGRSLQQELHLALRRDVRRNFDEAVAISSSWRERLKGRDLPDSTELLREDRAR